MIDILSRHHHSPSGRVSNCWGGRSWIGLTIRRKFRREHSESSVLFKGSSPSPSMPPIGAKLDPPRRGSSRNLVALACQPLHLAMPHGFQSGVIEFSGLDIGTEYQIQLWYSDQRSAIVAATKWRQHVAVDVSPQNRFALRIKPRSGDRKDRCRHFVAFEVWAVIFCGLTSTAIRCRHYRGWYAEHKAKSQQSDAYRKHPTTAKLIPAARPSQRCGTARFPH